MELVNYALPVLNGGLVPPGLGIGNTLFTKHYPEILSKLKLRMSMLGICTIDLLYVVVVLLHHEEHLASEDKRLPVACYQHHKLSFIMKFQGLGVYVVITYKLVHPCLNFVNEYAAKSLY